MAKAVKFPLEMNGEQVRDINALKEHFDIEKVVEYFLSGELFTWLEARYYDDEAAAVKALNGSDPAIAEKLSGIFGIPYTGESAVDLEELEKRKARLARLREYTDDEDILADIDLVAFDQEELAELYDRGAEEVILCAGTFAIPKSKKGLKYTRIGNAAVSGLEEPEQDKKKEEYQERQAVCSEIVEIDRPVKIKSGEKKTYQNIRVEFYNVIQCSGELTFMNCEIVTRDSENEYLSYNDESKNCRIFMDGGNLRFINCRIRYKLKAKGDAGYSNRRYMDGLITGRSAEVEFENCSLEGCENLVFNYKSGSVRFEGCTGADIVTPLVKGAVESVQILDSSMAACVMPGIRGVPRTHLPGTLDVFMGSMSVIGVRGAYGIVKQKDQFVAAPALLAVKGTDCVLSGSSFNGFISGVVYDCDNEDAGSSDMYPEKKVSITRSSFTECARIVEYVYNNETIVTLHECEFNKCMNLLPRVYRLSMSDCSFTDCYGAIVVRGKLESSSCRWKNGFIYLDGNLDGDIRLEKCVFEDLFSDNVQEKLYEYTDKDFKYYRFETKEDVDTIGLGFLSYGKSGYPLITSWRSGSIRACRYINVGTGKYNLMRIHKNVDVIEDNTFEKCSGGIERFI